MQGPKSFCSATSIGPEVFCESSSLLAQLKQENGKVESQSIAGFIVLATAEHLPQL